MCAIVRLFILSVGLLALTVRPVAAEPPCLDYSDYFRYVNGVPIEYVTYDFMGYNALAIKGRKAYAYQFGRGLRVIDLADPATPVHRGMLQLGSSVFCSGMTCLDHYVLMAGDLVRVADVDDHDNPVMAHTLDTPGYARDVAMSQRIVYIADDNAGLSVYDFDNPLVPEYLITLPTSDTAWSLCVHDALLLVGCNGWLDVFSLADPAAPSHLGAVSIAGVILEIAAEGDLAVVEAAWTANLVDLGDPAAPVLVSTFGDHSVRAVALRDGVAYLGGDVAPWWGGSLDRFDVSDPTAPSRTGRDIMNGWPGAITFALGYLYTANQGDWMDGAEIEGFHVYDPTNPASPPRTGYLDLYSYTFNWGTSALGGEFLYVVGDRELGVVDLSDPAAPTLRGTSWYSDSTLETGLVNGVVVIEHYYYPSYDYWLQTYRVDDPDDPVPVDTLDLPGISTINVRGDLIYLSSAGGVQVVEVTETGTMTIVGTFWQDNPVGAMVFAGECAVTVDSGGSLLVLEFPSVLAPEILGSLPPAPFRTRRPVQLVDDLVFVSHPLPSNAWPYNSAWEIIDISDPANPTVLCEVPLPFEEYFSDMVYGDGRVYVSGTTTDWVFDVADPAAPVALGQASHPDANNCKLHLGEGILVSHSIPGAKISVWPQQCGSPTSVAEEDRPPAPVALRLTVAPNPFNPRTTVSFGVDRKQRVEIAVYDLAGKRLTMLADRTYDAGEHSVVWHGKDASGHAMPSGTYVVRMSAEDAVRTMKVILIK